MISTTRISYSVRKNEYKKMVSGNSIYPIIDNIIMDAFNHELILRERRMIKAMKYIAISIFQTIRHDLKSTYKDLDRPRELVNIFFWLAIILIFTGRENYGYISIGLMMVSYIWRIIKTGDWKHMRRESYRQ